MSMPTLTLLLKGSWTCCKPKGCRISFATANTSHSNSKGIQRIQAEKKKHVAHTDSEDEPFSAIVIIFLSGLHLSLSSVGYFG